MKPINKGAVWMPLAIALAAVVGMVVGSRFSKPVATLDHGRKINTLLNLISDEYVDTVKISDLIEGAIPGLLSKLDPHTLYFTPSDLQVANDDLNGSFSGIGVSFNISNDTVSVVEVIPGGPSEKVGILAGDRIIEVNDSAFTGKDVTDTTVRQKLRGKKGSKVKLKIKRLTTGKTLNFVVTRGDIPVNSVSASYMIDKNTGYIKVDKFGRTTYDEFLNALVLLQSDGAIRYIVDLRGNGGGYMEMAILMVNEFLPSDRLIVFTKGRDKRNDSQVFSDGNGSFQDAEVVVLIDEYSASASEIFAGALQDNDRALVMGCRSFGKGLVQREFMLPDSSGVRMTIARYYTPSGRCIQKEYNHGDAISYDMELMKRYSNGELYHKDSVRYDSSKSFSTATGRKVYGGGGIIPDVFVPRDTADITPYYAAVLNSGVLQNYAFHYSDKHREQLLALKDYKHFLRKLPSNDVILSDFVSYAEKNGVPARWHYINKSKMLILTYLKALIARDIYGLEAFYPIFNRNDYTIDAALKSLNRHEAAFPIETSFYE